MPARTVTFELSEEQARWLDERVEAGVYPDAAAAVAEAVDAQRRSEEVFKDLLPSHELTDEELRAAVEPALKRLDAGRDHLLTAEQVFGRMTEAYFATRPSR